MGARKPRRPRQCQTFPCRRRATTRVVWHRGRVTYQCDRHAQAAERVAVRAGLPMLLTKAPSPLEGEGWGGGETGGHAT